MRLEIGSDFHQESIVPGKLGGGADQVEPFSEWVQNPLKANSFGSVAEFVGEKGGV